MSGKPISDVVLDVIADAVKMLMAAGRDGLILADKLNSHAPAIHAALTAAQQQQGQAVALPKLKRTHPSYSREEVQWVFGYNAALDDVMRLNKNTALAQQPAAVDEAASISAFEEHFQASSDDPCFEGELELWLTAWRKALAAQPGGAE